MDIKDNEKTKDIDFTAWVGIDKLLSELPQFTKVETSQDMQLNELLYAVETKCPGETRFETALRYIRDAEAKTRSLETTSLNIPD
jgi:hypothetical protein